MMFSKYVNIIAQYFEQCKIFLVIKMSEMKYRFEAEVERIGGVSAISQQLGVARNTIYGWIGKGNAPLHKLMGLRAMGMDVVYVITGEKGVASTIQPDEQLLLETYRELSPSDRKALLADLLSGQRTGGGYRNNEGVIVSGEGNTVAGRDHIGGRSSRKRK